MKKEVNAIGDICPIPLVKAKEAVKELNTAECRRSQQAWEAFSGAASMQSA